MTATCHVKVPGGRVETSKKRSRTRGLDIGVLEIGKCEAGCHLDIMWYLIHKRKKKKVSFSSIGGEGRLFILN